MWAEKISFSRLPLLKWHMQMVAFFRSDLRPSQHLLGLGGAGAVLLVRKSLHGISPIIDGRHSFGYVPVVGEEEGDSWCLWLWCLCLAPANGCGMTAIRAMARKKAMWHLDVAMDLFVCVCVLWKTSRRDPFI